MDNWHCKPHGYFGETASRQNTNHGSTKNSPDMPPKRTKKVRLGVINKSVIYDKKSTIQILLTLQRGVFFNVNRLNILSFWQNMISFFDFTWTDEFSDFWDNLKTQDDGSNIVFWPSFDLMFWPHVTSYEEISHLGE